MNARSASRRPKRRVPTPLQPDTRIAGPQPRTGHTRTIDHAAGPPRPSGGAALKCVPGSAAKSRPQAAPLRDLVSTPLAEPVTCFRAEVACDLDVVTPRLIGFAVVTITKPCNTREAACASTPGPSQPFAPHAVLSLLPAAPVAPAGACECAHESPPGLPRRQVRRRSARTGVGKQRHRLVVFDCLVYALVGPSGAAGRTARRPRTRQFAGCRHGLAASMARGKRESLRRAGAPVEVRKERQCFACLLYIEPINPPQHIAAHAPPSARPRRQRCVRARQC